MLALIARIRVDGDLWGLRAPACKALRGPRRSGGQEDEVPPMRLGPADPRTRRRPSLRRRALLPPGARPGPASLGVRRRDGPPPHAPDRRDVARPPGQGEPSPTVGGWLVFRPGEDARPRSASAAPRSAATPSGSGSILEYSYLLLVFALIPLVVSFLGSDNSKPDIAERCRGDASPGCHARASGVAIDSRSVVSTPGAARRHRRRAAGAARLDGGPSLGARHDGPLGLRRHRHGRVPAADLALFFLRRAGQPGLALPASALFTGTVGIVFLLRASSSGRGTCGPQRDPRPGVVPPHHLPRSWCSSAGRMIPPHDPEANFFLSALGFTFGVRALRGVHQGDPPVLLLQEARPDGLARGLPLGARLGDPRLRRLRGDHVLLADVQRDQRAWTSTSSGSSRAWQQLHAMWSASTADRAERSTPRAR